MSNITLIITILAAFYFPSYYCLTVIEDRTGCDAYKEIMMQSKISECLMKDVELLPNIYSEALRVSSIDECRKECRKRKNCEYITVQTDKNRNTLSQLTRKSICYLKPAPGPLSSPIMVLRLYTKKSMYTYISGPVKTTECSETCIDGKEVMYGCKASSPVTCPLLVPSVLKPQLFEIEKSVKQEILPHHEEAEAKHGSEASTSHTINVTATPVNALKLFSAECLVDYNLKGCSRQREAYPCCTTSSTICERTSTCLCKSFKHQTLLISGETIDYHLSAIRSPQECLTLCIVTKGCTDFNFVISSTTAYIGGACYLKRHAQKNEVRHTIKAPGYTNAVAGIGCHDGSELLTFSQVTKDRPPFFDVPVLRGSTCFYGQVKLNEKYVLESIYKAITPNMCQAVCKIYPGCLYFMHTAYSCSLYFTNEGSTKISSKQDTTIVGPRDCYMDPEAPLTEDAKSCLLFDTEFEGDELGNGGTVSNVQICSVKCSAGCEGWTFYPETKECKIRSRNLKPKASKGNISGYRSKCTLRALNPLPPEIANKIFHL